MKQWKTWTLAAALLIAGCAQESAEVNCGSGDKLSTSKGDLCVYSQKLEGNTQVVCPEGMAFQQQYGDYVVCSDDETLPPDFRDQMVSSYGEDPLPPENVALCTTDSDCAAGELCTQGACQPSTTASCMSNDECAAGEMCLNGVCEDPSNIDTDGDGIEDGWDNCPDVPNADQHDHDMDGIGDACQSNTNSCTTDSDCAAGELCAQNTCVQITMSQCQTNADCAANQQCVQDVCEDISGTDTDGDGIEDSQDNCPFVANPNQEDHNMDGIGDACQTVLQCQASADCAAGEVCVQGACVQSAQQCQSDNDCASGEYCYAGICETSQPTVQCVADADCAVGEFCNMGTCAQNTPQQCQSDNDCAVGQQCVQGACTLP